MCNKKCMDNCPDIKPKVGEVMLCCHDMVISTAIRELILATFPESNIRQVSDAYSDTMALCHVQPNLIIGAVSSPLCVRRVAKQLTWLKQHFPEVPMVYLHGLSGAVFCPFAGIIMISMMSSLEDIVTVFHLALLTPVVEEKFHKKYNLTCRQKHILRLIVKKKRNCEIARELGLSQKTVSCHRKGIRERLGLTRKQERLFIGELSALMASGNALPFWSEGMLAAEYWEES